MNSKGFERRKKTLLVEYKNQFKSNKFTDKRIGENDNNLSLEDKMFKRFVVERQKPRDKKNKKFNLNDDDDQFNDQINGGGTNGDLTHFGQSLSQIENFEKVQLSDDDDVNDPNDIDKGKISAKIVSESFFGGFNKKTDDDESNPKNRKQWVDEMIMKSKQIKYERQKERDKTLDLTEQLDKEWRNILPLMGSIASKAKKEQEDAEKLQNKKADDFDVLVKSLQFDSKAKPTDKIKSPEDIERELLEQKNKNERELIERMKSEVQEEDDDDNNKTRKKKILSNKLKKIPANHISVDDMEFDDPEYLQMLNRDDIKQKRSEENDSKNENSKEESENEEEESSNSDSGSSNSKDENENNSTKESMTDNWLEKFKQICLKMDQKSIDLNKFDKSIKSLIESLDPSRDEKNKQRICLFTSHLIEYYQSLFDMENIKKKSLDYKLVKLLTSYVYNLTFKYGNKSTKKDPSIFVDLFKKLLKQINDNYLNLKINEKKIPTLEMLFTFKLISNVFPTSDFRHQVTTPCLLIMTRYLTQCSIDTISESFRGSFLCNLCYEFTNASKRYIPECVQYLNGVLYLSIDWNKNANKLSNYELSTIYESFKRTKLNFLIDGKVDLLSDISIVKICQIENQKSDDSTIASIIAYNLDLLIAFANNYESIISFKEIFHLTNLLLKLLPIENYPKEVKSRVDELQELIISTSEKKREYLKCMNKKPVPNKLHEPKIISKSKFDPRHHNSVISEKQLLRRKHKKELKSAIKEIRQDNKFLARVQLDEQLEKDAKRARKVKEIMGGLAAQEGDYQRAKRMKN